MAVRLSSLPVFVLNQLKEIQQLLLALDTYSIYFYDVVKY